MLGLLELFSGRCQQVMSFTAMQHAVDHLRHHAEIVARVGKPVDRAAVETARHFGHAGEHVRERAMSPVCARTASEACGLLRANGCCANECFGTLALLSTNAFLVLQTA